ncbi:hypothetical protein CL689_02290 [Candidatus Saccharibacteria bacterium]|nr:hypothetical protein [Candidatus Saccharibacteria bacterium]|tara:strand:- start:1416 stop:1817 length:402 start_codon:yes stop_codon:yes gene_type:complete
MPLDHSNAPSFVPVAAECRFAGEAHWNDCSIEHHELVTSNPAEWPGYETRLLYAFVPDAAESEKEPQANCGTAAPFEVFERGGKICFQIGVQRFTLDYDFEVQEDLDFMKQMLEVALGSLVDQAVPSRTPLDD